MNSVTNNGTQKDFPPSLAILILLAGFLGYEYLTFFRFYPGSLDWIGANVNQHSNFWWVVIGSAGINIAVIGTYFRRIFGLAKQGSKLEVLEGKSKFPRIGSLEMLSGLIAGVVIYFQLDLIAENLYQLLKVFVTAAQFYKIRTLITANLSIAAFFISRISLQLLAKLRSGKSRVNKLTLPEVGDGELVIGTTGGDLNHEILKIEPDQVGEDWVKLSGRALNGGILVTGSPGSGKTAGAILRPLSQVFKWKNVPSLLCVDPKGTFIKETEKMLTEVGVGGKIARISLDGEVTFNPVYTKDPLKNSRFVELAEMVRSASVNFLGKSNESPFWEVSSSTLIRNAIVYCAAVKGYFTLVDLYRSIIRASSDPLGEEMRTALSAKSFDEEERFNIECAVEYFDNEYGKLEDRVRSGIVATSTAFINLFQEYSANRIFCPAESNISIKSMEEFVQTGGSLLFDINKPGLGRSMGTFVKLHYQQAVLNSISQLKETKSPVSTVIVIDEYQDVVTCAGGGTLGDDSFMAKAREAKPLVIVATQSVSSLMNAVGSQRATLELIQNFRTRIACHSSDIETINLFKELIGLEEKDSETRSISESSRSSQLNLLVGGFDSADSSLNESVSRMKKNEFIVSGREFSRLNSFECFAQVYDGVRTRFLKLYLKPNFLKKLNTRHADLLSDMNGEEKKKSFSFVSLKLIVSLMALVVMVGQSSPSFAQIGFPNACTVVNTPAFDSCLEMTTSGCTCGFPPHPCALISYYVPQTFIEVWPEPRTTYFPSLPGAAAQLSSLAPIPFGAEGDDDTQSFHAHTLAIPMDTVVFRALPSGGSRMEKTCFDGMSEHFLEHWQTGKGDLLQPLFLAWAASPKLCLMKGAVTSVTGEPEATLGSDSPVCSFPTKLPTLPPSTHSACNGWGTFYPRCGTYTGPASMAGALMIASRMKSLSTEVLHSMPGSPDEKWQMIYPGSSSCFREGQNVGLLETIKNAREVSRLTTGKLKGYLFAIWGRTTACNEMTSIAQAQAALAAARGVCRGMQ